MTHFVRGYVRERFLKADVGVNGCNFAVAASGTCTIVSNEGNGRMASSIPKTQVIFLGTERIVPDFKALDVMMEMLNRSAVGSKISNYFSMMTGPGRAGEADGPEETHIIIIDNGRSGILGGTFQEMLRCIRCGACIEYLPCIPSHFWSRLWLRISRSNGCCIDSIVQRLRRSRRSSICFHIVRRMYRKLSSSYSIA